MRSKGDKGIKGDKGSKGKFFPFGAFGSSGTFGTSQFGFTLIELLIVVAIIGILSALLMTNFIGIRQRARDAQRKSDIRQMQSALELYRADTGGYPAPGGTNTLVGTPCPSPAALKSVDNTTTYMQRVPCDPLGATYYHTGSYYYAQGAGGATYTLAACLENTSDTDIDSTFPADNTCSSGKFYVKKNP